MNIRFDKKRVLVTGAGKGIGRETVKALVECGAEIFALSRTQSDLDSLKAEAPNIHVYQVDLRDWNKTKEVEEKMGPIDLLVNNAGVVGVESIVDVSPVKYADIMDTNVRAVVNVTQVVTKGMIDRGNGGAIVNVSSIASKCAMANNMGIYSASKAALDSLTRTMARELGPRKIRCNSVNPFCTFTPMSKQFLSDPVLAKPLLDQTPMGRFCEIKDTVHPILYLLSDKADMITGATLNIDGGCGAC